MSSKGPVSKCAAILAKHKWGTRKPSDSFGPSPFQKARKEMRRQVKQKKTKRKKQGSKRTKQGVEEVSVPRNEQFAKGLFSFSKRGSGETREQARARRQRLMREGASSLANPQ